MDAYLFVLGKDPQLSRAELRTVSNEILFDDREGLYLGENLHFTNPRNLPQDPHQLFLNRLGGTIRFAQIVDEYTSETVLFHAIKDTILKEKPEGKVHLGVSSFGIGKNFTKEMMAKVKGGLARDHERNVRIINIGGEKLTSGKIFGEKLLKKGFEFIIWKRGSSFLLCKTVACQNLRNYTLRDHEKTFRDAKMGMLPPKLAQILINLAQPEDTETVIDPFCGSGTVNIEAGIRGNPTVGSDKEDRNVKGSRENWEQLSAKFRYETSTGEFFTSDAKYIDWSKYEGVIATEGWLGHNFTTKPTRQEVEQNAHMILALWEEIFMQLKGSKVRQIALCTPVWGPGREHLSLSQKLFALAKKSGYTPVALCDQLTYVYAREGAYVGREISVLRQQ